MNISYIAHIRLPTEKAHGIQTMNTCYSLGTKGAHVELAIPTRRNTIDEDPFTYYGLKKNFKIRRLFSPDLIRLGMWGYRLQHALFIFSAIVYGLRTRSDIYYSRDEVILLFLRFTGKRVVWETHEGRYTFLSRIILKYITGVVCISKGLQQFYQEKGVPASKICVAHDAVDIAKFNLSIRQQEAREKVNLPTYKKIVTYTGSLYLYKWKGVNVLLDAAKKLNDDYITVLVGGSKKEIAAIKEKYPSNTIICTGHRPHNDIPYYLKASDVLVIPNQKGDIISERFTSPMKLFEYMASGVPIVASQLPSLEEILSSHNSVLVQSDNVQALADAIKHITTDPLFAEDIQRQALRDVHQYTWDHRADVIYSFLKTCIS
ncbi:glycosyltransferase [Candidatus Parcubacteria bacterium]|nr:glycosyltransferase [Candidatus Parcubacteria bacterium]